MMINNISKKALFAVLILTLGMLCGTANAATDARFSMDFEDRPIKQVLKEISDKAKVNLIVKEGEGRKISISVNNLPWEQLVELIAVQYGYRIDKRSDVLWFLSSPPRITLAFKDADIRTIIEVVATKVGWNFIVDPDIKGKLTLSLTGVPWKKALDVILATGNYRWVEDDNKIIRITTEAKLLQNMVTRIIRLKYIKPKGEEIKALLISEVAGKYAEDASQESKDSSFAILDVLGKLKSSAGSLSYDALNNALIIKDSPAVIKEMEVVILNLDVRPLQISIDTELVDAQIGDISEIGTKWENGLQLINNQGVGTINDTKFPLRFGNGIENIVRHLGNFSFNLDGSSSTFLLQMLKEKSETKVIQSPSITTLDNQKAMIFIGETLRYGEQTTTIASDTGVATTTFSEASNSPLALGNMLLVIPHAIKETNDIMLTVVPYESALDRFEDFGNGALRLPQTTTNVAVTKMILKSGQTGIIGGRTTSTDKKVDTSIPFLGNIPIVGWLFKSRAKTDSQRKLLMFITPTILDNRGPDKLVDYLEKLKEKAVDEQQIGLPRSKSNTPTASTGRSRSDNPRLSRR